MRRARAACEKLVALLGDECPTERRDLAVLLMLCGEFVKSGGFRESCRAQGESNL
jgi:hypothetical protein